MAPDVVAVDIETGLELDFVQMDRQKPNTNGSIYSKIQFYFF